LRRAAINTQFDFRKDAGQARRQAAIGQSRATADWSNIRNAPGGASSLQQLNAIYGPPLADQNEHWEPAILTGPALALSGAGELRSATVDANAPLRLQATGKDSWVLLARPMSAVRACLPPSGWRPPACGFKMAFHIHAFGWCLSVMLLLALWLAPYSLGLANSATSAPTAAAAAMQSPTVLFFFGWLTGTAGGAACGWFYRWVRVQLA
jgi:hypothetical protein